MELDNAPLPAPKRRGRPPKLVTLSTPSSSENGWVKRVFDDAPNHVLDAAAYLKSGWTTGVVATRFPPACQDMLIGGYFNGQYRNMAEHSDERYACIGVEDDLRVEWYERCDKPGAWVWVASVYPNGIELRGVFQ